MKFEPTGNGAPFGRPRPDVVQEILWALKACPIRQPAGLVTEVDEDGEIITNFSVIYSKMR